MKADAANPRTASFDDERAAGSRTGRPPGLRLPVVHPPAHAAVTARATCTAVTAAMLSLCLDVAGGRAQAGASFTGSDSVVSVTQPVHLDAGSTLRDLLRHPAFTGFAHLLLPWDNRAYDEQMPLTRIGSLLPYHTHVDTASVTSALNRMIDDVAGGRRCSTAFTQTLKDSSSPRRTTQGCSSTADALVRHSRSSPRAGVSRTSAPFTRAFRTRRRSAGRATTPSC